MAAKRSGVYTPPTTQAYAARGVRHLEAWLRVIERQVQEGIDRAEIYANEGC